MNQYMDKSSEFSEISAIRLFKSFELLGPSIFFTILPFLSISIFSGIAATPKSTAIWPKSSITIG